MGCRRRFSLRGNAEESRYRALDPRAEVLEVSSSDMKIFGTLFWFSNTEVLPETKPAEAGNFRG